MFLTVVTAIPIGITDMILGRRRVQTNHCNACDYDMRATTNGICPECGHLNAHLQEATVSS